MSLLNRVTQIAQAVKVDEAPVYGININEEYVVEEHLRKGLP